MATSKITSSVKRFLGLGFMVPAVMAAAIAAPNQLPNAQAQTANNNRALTVRADVQEANSNTGVVTARGNVQIAYPARQIQGTATQAQYYSRERRIVLSGNVYVLQQGNSLRADTITYLIDEGRFVALPTANRQVESVYLVNEDNINEPAASARNR